VAYQSWVLVKFEKLESYFPGATIPESLFDSQSDSLMEVALFTGIVSFKLSATLKGLVTKLKLVTMASMRLPESETMKLCVPVPVRIAPVLSKAAPTQFPP
jgi:hypothetical protein